jgi:tetratricopeptide (TPR) repeat protein
VTIQDQGTLKMSEGNHQIKIAGPIDATENFAVSSGYFQRFFYRPVWLLNVNGEALIIEANIQYATNPAPTIPKYHLGETFVSFEHVDYLFEEEPPKSISVKGNQTVMKRQVEMAAVSAEVILSQLGDQNPHGAMKVAERVLTRTSDSDVMDQYIARAKTSNQKDRALRFLEQELDRRPIDIEWHRHFQDVKDQPATFAELQSRYQKLTETEPDSPAVWYLFARKDANDARALESLAKALELDPKFGWALLMRGNRAMQRHEWDNAHHDLVAAAGWEGADSRWLSTSLLTLLAQRRYDDALAEAENIKEIPAVRPFLLLMHAWIDRKQNRPVDRQKVINDFLGPAAGMPQSAGARAYLELALAYVAADWDAVRGLHQNPALQSLTPAKKNAQLMTETIKRGTLQQVFPQPGSGLTDWEDLLSVGLAFELSGNHETATAWMNHGIERLKAGSLDERELAEALSGANSPDVDAVRTIYVQPTGERAVAFAALAWKFPAQRDVWLAEANLWQLLPVQAFWIVDEYLKAQGVAPL